MKKRMGFLFVMFLVLVMIGCGGKKEAAAGKADTVRIMIGGTGGGISDWDNDPILQAVEKATNTDIKMEWVDGLTELLTAGAASAEFPDIAAVLDHGAKTFLQTLVDNEIIAAYEGDVAAAAPNVIKEYSDNPNLVELKINGKIYLQPVYWGKDTYPNMGLINLRKDILDKYGLKEPSTWNEYVEFLRICVTREKINGVAFGLSSSSLNVYLGSYGVPYTGWFKNKNGNYQYWLTAEPIIDAIIAYRKLIAEGLVDPNSFTYTGDSMRTAYVSGQVGSYISNGGGHIGRYQNDMALVNPAFIQWMLPAIDCGGGGRGYTEEPMYWGVNVIGGTKSNNPVAAARVVDYLISAEGEKLTAIGIEGQDYTYDAAADVYTTLEAKFDHGFPRAAGAAGSHPLAQGIVSWQPQEWQNFILLYGKGKDYENWFNAMWENQGRYKVPSYGISITTPEWTEFQATGNDLFTRAFTAAFQASSDTEARQIWTAFLEDWKNAGGVKASASVENILKQLYN
jgi:putative aldouronate transport system substrate-binding protein